MKKDYLTPKEFAQVLEVAKENPRDYLFVIMMYQHGYRVSELINLPACFVDIQSKVVYVKRLKHSMSTHQPMTDEEIAAYKEHSETELFSEAHVFLRDDGRPLTRFAAHHLIKQLGKKARLGFPLHPHMLRHSCGYYLANKGCDTRLIQDYLGHIDINVTVRYTKVNHERFKGLF